MAAGIVGGVWLLVIQVPTVDVMQLTAPAPGGDTCWANPFELTGVFPGEVVAFTNRTNSTVKIKDDTGLFTETPPPIPPGGTIRLKVKDGAASGKHWYSLSCAPSGVGESRPRIVVRSSTPGTPIPGGQ